jgi:SAM-dependent methyltransferase
MPSSATPGERGADLAAMSDLRTPWCLHVVATLGVAERIADGVDEIAGLAAATGSDREALRGVLGHLVDRGVFEEPAPGRFALNDAARGLLDPGTRLGLDLDGIGGRMAHAWGTLLTYVRTGSPGYAEVFGRTFWEDLAAHPEVAASFDRLMGPAGHGTPDPEVPLADGWAAVRTVVDVGGGTGAMLAEILRARPEVRGTLVDLPGTVERAGPAFREAGVADRASTVGQSFLDPLPTGADLYLLRGILNDWPDAGATEILRRCAEAARPSGRVVVLKGVRPDDAPPRVEIETVLLGGRQRTVAELRDLGRRAGLELVAAGRQASGVDAIEFRPASPA